MPSKPQILSRALMPCAVAAALAFVGCKTPVAAPAPAPEVLLRSYTVPQGYERDITSMLQRVLEGVGRAQVGPGGQLVVVGPAQVQVGVQTLVEQLAHVDPAPAAPAPVALTYWIVVGRPATRGGSGAKVIGPAPLTDLAPALTELSAAQGPMEFGLLERLHLVSSGDRGARAVGTLATIEQRAARARQGLFADIDIRLTPHMYAMNTQARLESGKYLVLGQTGCPATLLPAWAREAGGGFDLFYVVLAESE